MSECHKCKTATEIEEGTWKDVPFDQTPCARCQLREDSYGTLEYQEGNIVNSSLDGPDDEVWTKEQADDRSLQPYTSLDGDKEDPQVPLSALVEAMQLWVRLSLPARRTFQLRMAGVPYSDIGKRLGVSRQMAFKLVQTAINSDARLQSLVPSKKHHASNPLPASRKSATMDSVMTGSIKSAEKGQKTAVLSPNKPLTCIA